MKSNDQKRAGAVIRIASNYECPVNKFNSKSLSHLRGFENNRLVVIRTLKAITDIQLRDKTYREVEKRMRLTRYRYAREIEIGAVIKFENGQTYTVSQIKIKEEGWDAGMIGLYSDKGDVRWRSPDEKIMIDSSDQTMSDHIVD